MMRSMVIDMNDEQLHTLAQMQAFLDGTVAVEFAVALEERYGFIARTVRRFGYARLKRVEKTVVLRSPGAGQRLFAPTAHPAGQTGLRTRPTPQALSWLAHQFCAHLHQR